MRKVIAVPLFTVIWIAITIFALLWGLTYNWPDFLHIDYGFPLTWATNTLSTIAGPTDTWSVNILNLLFDLVLWNGIMVAVVFVIIWKVRS
jgi:hypothetical protein